MQRKEKRKEKKERWQNDVDKDEEDELANQFHATMNISTKRRRIHDV